MTDKKVSVTLIGNDGRVALEQTHHGVSLGTVVGMLWGARIEVSDGQESETLMIRWPPSGAADNSDGSE